MKTRQLSRDEQALLLNTLKNYYPDENETSINWQSAAPLLALIIPDRHLAKLIKENFQLITDHSQLIKNLTAICDQFIKKGILNNNNLINPYHYRLPLIMGEYPRHTKVINNTIKAFNQIVEAKTDFNDKDESEKLNQALIQVVNKISIHGPFCFTESLADLVNIISGYNPSCRDLFEDSKQNLEELENPVNQLKPDVVLGKSPKIISSKTKNKIGSLTPFREQNCYLINTAGRLTAKNSKLVVNGFGLKFGGHFDGLETHTPTLLQIGDFYSILWRELSQRIELPTEESDEAIQLRIVLLTTLKKFGMVIQSTKDNADLDDLFISPFSTEPQVFMTPTAVKKRLSESAIFHQFKLTDEMLLTLSDYLSQILYRMQFNISEALGIGANDDNTVSFSNEGRDYIFQFDHDESEWADRFAHISKHRQGPAQPHMNAGKGVQYELAAAFLTESSRMSQLQRSEYEETIYNAIIDNFVTDFFPHPDFFENQEYKKYRKQYFLTSDHLGRTQLTLYIEESATGIFKENGQTTPRFRRPGTIDVHPLPKDHPGICEASKSFNSRNPLAARQFQYIEAMQNGTRGDYVYNPFGPDSFIPDMFEGQVIKNSDGSFLPFIGVIPKNFDKAFKQPAELCASFVVRMLHSSRLMSHCPTFLLNYQRMKNNFVPTVKSIPDLPPLLSKEKFLLEKMKHLKESLCADSKDVSFQRSEKLLASLFKNIVYHLRAEANEKAFSIFHYRLVNDADFLNEISRENFEKIIRVLKINAPVENETTHQNFILKVNYLENLINAFYPAPCNGTATLMKEQARIYLKFLTWHPDIQDYFQLLKNNPHANLSRQQSPGMLFVKLREDAAKKQRSLKEKCLDFDRMHQKNFIAGYRDQEGSLVVAPTNSEKILDYTAKGVGKLSVSVQHDSNPIGQIITAPIMGAYDGMKNNYVPHSIIPNIYSIPLGITSGLASGVTQSGFKAISYGLKFIARPGLRAIDAVTYCHSKIDTRTMSGKITLAGLFIPAIFGIVAGITESFAKLVYDCTVSPVKDLITIFSSSHQEGDNRITDHALYIPALPDNEPGFKIRMSDLTRDTIIKSMTPASLIEKLKIITFDIVKTAHPDTTKDEQKLIVSTLISTSMLKENEWHDFYNIFNIDNEINNLLRLHHESINTALISALYRCFLERSNDEKRLKMIEPMMKFYKLLPEQKYILKTFIDYFNHHPDEQEKLIIQFSEAGIIKNTLSIRNNLSQNIHDIVMHAFNAEIIKNILSTTHGLSRSLSTEKNKIQNQINKANMMINELKQELKELNPGEYAVISEINEHIKSLTISLYQAQLDLDQYSQEIATRPNENLAVLSNKDKAHRKWKLFATRELMHEFLSKDEIHKIFEILDSFPFLKNSLTLQLKIAHLKKQLFLLMKHCDPQGVDEFYVAYQNLKKIIFPIIFRKKYPSNLITTLDNMANVIINAALNKMLDNAGSTNPLNESKSFQSWLHSIYHHKSDFQSLLSQQRDQPFMHLTILRQAYIIQCLESALKITHPQERIRKTGLQKLLRIHYLEKNVVKRNGASHYETRHIDDFGIYLKTRGIEKSPTFDYANMRAKMKLGIFAERELSLDIRHYEKCPARRGDPSDILDCHAMTNV